jgi:hypothetical protein
MEESFNRTPGERMRTPPEIERGRTGYPQIWYPAEEKEWGRAEEEAGTGGGSDEEICAGFILALVEIVGWNAGGSSEVDDVLQFSVCRFSDIQAFTIEMSSSDDVVWISI